MPPLRRAPALIALLAALSAPPAVAQGIHASRPASPGDAPPIDPFAPDVRTYEMSGIYLPESWNKNLATDRLAGATVTAGASWAPGWQGITEFSIGRALLARSPDALYVGVTGGVRRRLAGGRRASVFVDVLVGIAVGNRHVPGDGTSFNWIAQGGGGVLWRLSRHAYGVTGVRVLHLSNGGIQGDHRNPDIEAVGGYAGLGWAF